MNKKEFAGLLLGFVLAITPSTPCAAQTTLPKGVGLQYSDVFIGRNFSINYSTRLNRKWRGYIGLAYFLRNTKDFEDLNYFYKKRFYPEDGLQSIGVRLGLEKRLPIKQLVNSEIYRFYDLQISRGKYRNQSLLKIGQYTNGEPVYALFESNVGPRICASQTFGIGGRFMITNKIFFNAMAGLGLDLFYTSKANAYSIFDDGMKAEFSRMFGLGIDYKL